MAPRLTRPFSVDFETSRTLDTLEVWIDFQTSVNDEARVGVLEIMTTFAALGSSGCLSGSTINPGRASINLEVSQLKGTSGHWVFRDVSIDPASVCILLNMIHWAHLEMVPVRRARLAWPEKKFPSDPLEIQFPELWQQLSYLLDIGDLLGDIDLDIELEHPQTKEVTERIVNTMAMWLLATHRGAYADESFDPAESRVYLGPDVMSVKPQRITWYIDTMRCNDSAIDGLLNLLEWVSQKLAPIRHVELGP
jgi:hypothetical protein